LVMTGVMLLQGGLGLFSGSLIGFSLGLGGGGGSILAVPLLVYVVGVGDPHVAIGTSAVAVAANAATNLLTHARHGNGKWACASVFAAAGVVGAFIGSSLGKMVEGHKLLAQSQASLKGIGRYASVGPSDPGSPLKRSSQQSSLPTVPPLPRRSRKPNLSGGDDYPIHQGDVTAASG
jgi:uncharacterized protein